MDIFVTFVVQIIMGIFGGQMISTSRGWNDITQPVKIIAGAIGGLACGLLVGGLVGDANSFFAMLGDAGGGLAGGAGATALVRVAIKKLGGR
ncbi:hypothetical protein [Thalassovita taeanensis]|uniref:Uncharacterized protein n=1 Tax=Thalassovita taeanensis TaxID=657014 RepID=A0A1H9J8P3_9RHOB|nr:hypothetical protein [Thalassovita taeanensis]SEQ83099.1 hypothetical protein SAMN04488092_11451 [Thalassovita taeanensis]